MRLQKRKGTVDGYEWRCRNQSKDNRHDVVRSRTRAPPSPQRPTPGSRRQRGGECPREKKFGGVTGMNGLRAASFHCSSTPKIE
ncbi:hypothetical protein TNCV_198771 [Trichonephila clavipes]|nr:hypothetical protein TNCV_198771 [Trichonephila clavipes]